LFDEFQGYITLYLLVEKTWIPGEYH
jgi:hypothetical protein